ncbi:MAG: cupin domain-containing protein [Pseudorhodoplanes sp.]|jgi:mannose-6-phosphate isomerase-like protein (cupin superfamily)|nr:cupin domain-containing protein [Pseudorhodoplanes sp.]
MAYVFNQDEMPKMTSVIPGRERIPFVNKDLAGTQDLLAGVQRLSAKSSSPYHYHEKCEHFYFILEGSGSIDTEDGNKKIEAGDLVFIPEEEKHRLNAVEDILMFEFQGPYKHKTVILDGGAQGLTWKQVDGTVRSHIK